MAVCRIANVVTWLMLMPAANLSLSWMPVFGKPTNMSQSQYTVSNCHCQYNGMYTLLQKEHCEDTSPN